MQETFVEIDYMLLSDEGHEKLKEIVIAHKTKGNGPVPTLEKEDENNIR